MRALCLILVLVNALFFSWAQLIDVKRSELDRPPLANTNRPPRIVLAREVATPPPSEERAAAERPMEGETARAEVPAAPAEPVAIARVEKSEDTLACTSVGPFADLADASHAQAVLRTAGFEPRQRLEQGEMWVGYWVSVQNLESREDAEIAVKMLADSGITDVYLMPGTDPANVLSLGVFSDYQRAQRRAAQVKTLGLEPRIDDRKRAGTVYWIDVDLLEPGQAIDTSMFQTGPGKIMRLELKACPAVGSG